jgi:hypothetical protein
MWFIFVSPQEFGGRGNRYFAEDGTVTNSPKLAAKFPTARAAHKFAQDKRIKLNGATQYIAHQDFHESDIYKTNGAEPKFLRLSYFWRGTQRALADIKRVVEWN